MIDSPRAESGRTSRGIACPSAGEIKAGQWLSLLAQIACEVEQRAKSATISKHLAEAVSSLERLEENSGNLIARVAPSGECPAP